MKFINLSYNIIENITYKGIIKMNNLTRYTNYIPENSAELGDCSYCRDPLSNDSRLVAHEGEGIKHPEHYDCIKQIACQSIRTHKTPRCSFCRTVFDPHPFLTWKEKCIEKIYLTQDDMKEAAGIAFNNIRQKLRTMQTSLPEPQILLSAAVLGTAAVVADVADTTKIAVILLEGAMVATTGFVGSVIRKEEEALTIATKILLAGTTMVAAIEISNLQGDLDPLTSSVTLAATVGSGILGLVGYGLFAAASVAGGAVKGLYERHIKPVTA